jgi:mono/diheme cytochrome c family protein
LILLVLLWSITAGWGLAQMAGARSPRAQRAAEPEFNSSTAIAAEIGTTDPVPPTLKLGQDSYLETCAACHIGIPPAVLPTETWRQLLQDSEHYGVNVQPLQEPFRRLVWNYLQTFSRPLKGEENIPYRISESRYFKALHPKVKFTQAIQLNSCATCHPSASQFDFRSLTPEWENAP